MDNKQDILNFNLGIARFASVTDEEQLEIMEDRLALNTIRVTKSNMKILTQYLLGERYASS